MVIRVRDPGAKLTEISFTHRLFSTITRARVRIVPRTLASNDDRDSGHPARRILGPNLFPFTSNVSRAKRCTDPRKRGFNAALLQPADAVQSPRRVLLTFPRNPK
jgi:hypothetical protein